MALEHHSAYMDCTDAPLVRLSPACAISHDDFETKPDEGKPKKINELFVPKKNNEKELHCYVGQFVVDVDR